MLFLIATLACANAIAQAQARTQTPAQAQTTPQSPTASSNSKKSEPARAAATIPASAATTKPAGIPFSAIPAAPKEDCGCEVKGLPETFAVVNGTKITAQNIEQQVGARVSELQQQIVAARRHELELQINSKLLKAEAKKRSTTEARLLEEEIITKVKAPTEAEAQDFYEKNRGRIEGDFKDVHESIISYLLNQRQGEAAGQFAQHLRATYPVKVLNAEAAPPKSEAERARVLAEVNGEFITSGEIEDSLRPLIFNVQQRVYGVREQELEKRINNLLLSQEALKRKITTQALLDAELGPKIPKVTEADARKFYEQNQERLMGDFAQLKDQIIQYMQGREVEKAGDEFASQLRRTAAVQIFLAAPEPPRYSINTTGRPSKGNPAAPVTIVEFTDYQCPSCAKAQPVIEKLVQEYGAQVKLVVRSFPLAQHPNAYKAAEAAEAAFEQGKYWEYSSLLIQNQSALETSKLKEYATRVGMDRSSFDTALDSGKYADRVQRDIQEGIGFGINSTPSVFVNGRQVMDKSYEALKAAIETALKERAAKTSGATASKT
jgi:protein-disulfide isomerase